jgi:hypothetical protein
MFDEENQSYEIVVPTDENLNPQVDLSGYTSDHTWNDNREPIGLPPVWQQAQTTSSSQSDRGRGYELGSSNIWEQTSAHILNAVAQTGINVYAQRNGVYSSQLPQNTQSNASPRQKQQSQQPMLMLALIIGAIYVMGK